MPQVQTPDATETKSEVAVKPMLTLSEVAQLLNVHPNSVRRWSNMGLLPTYRLGCRGDRRFRPQDVDDFLVSWEQESA